MLQCSMNSSVRIEALRPGRLGFIPRPVRMGFMVEKVAFGTGFSLGISSYPITAIPPSPMLSVLHQHTSFEYSVG